MTYGAPILGSDRVSRQMAMLLTDLGPLSRHESDRRRLASWLAQHLNGRVLNLDVGDGDGPVSIVVGAMYSANDRWVNIDDARAQLPPAVVDQFSVSHTGLVVLSSPKGLDCNLGPWSFPLELAVPTDLQSDG